MDQLTLDQLAIGVPRQRIDDENLAGLLVGMQLGPAISQDLLRFRARTQHHERRRART